jgi:type VI secretion system secreted protein VgrG
VQSGAPDDKPSHKEPGDKSKTGWIEIQLVDDAGKPVAGESYEVEMADGTVASGTTGADGVARVSGIDPGTCKVRFPNLDKDAWEPA